MVAGRKYERPPPHDTRGRFCSASVNSTSRVFVAATFLMACATLVPGASAQEDRLVPAWVDQVFELYLNGQIPETNLLDSLAFLIDNDIIQVAEQDAPADRGIDDVGDFYVTYKPNPNSNSEYVYSAAEYLQETRLLEDNAEWLNENYKLEYDVEIRGAECGTENAFYDRSEKAMTMCYEFVDSIRDIGYELYYEQDAEEFTYNVLDAVLLHETGHALVDIYDLPITGMEEDAVDQFSALIQSRTYNDYEPDYETSRNMMLDAADFWDYRRMQNEQNNYAGVHSLDIQRFHNIACYAYGADSEYNIDLVGEYLPEDRAIGCPDEYQKMSSSWDRLLEGYVIE